MAAHYFILFPVCPAQGRESPDQSGQERQYVQHILDMAVTYAKYYKMTPPPAPFSRKKEKKPYN